MTGIAWGTLIVGVLIGWLLVPMALGFFKAKSAG
jgi:hypothetical protein